MFALIRTILYAVFLLWALLTFVLAAALIGKTEKAGLYALPYYRASAELLATGILSFIVAPLHFLFHRRATASILAVFWVELAVVGVLWMLYLGSAAMANQLPGLDYCRGYSVCDIASALEAFAWLSWITLTFQLVVLLFTGVREHTRGRPSVWTEPWSISGAGEPAANNNTAMKEAPAPTSV